MAAIAFKKPFTVATQDRRDSIDMEQHDIYSVNCSRCQVEYVLIYPSDASEERVALYRQAVDRGMANCAHHPPFIEMNF